MAKAWGGRFESGTDARVEQFTESISFDRRLYRHDVAASVAHAVMLAEVGLITPEECDAICRTLREIESEIADGRFEFDVALEDIHLHIESELIRRLGDAGRKLHTARSRNDQVATDLKLWIRDEIDSLDPELAELQRSLVRMADRSGELILPGYTHLQRAQPVLAAHYLLAHVEKYQRDRSRLSDCRARLNSLPLGAAALAGTSLPINRERTAKLLSFDRVAANSLDVSSDRDFVLETAFVLAMIAEHLSSWAEEWILWTTTEFDFLRLPDEFCTGSSIMPHKKNPDVLELIRGKTGRVVGALTALLVMVKGLPLAYNRDFQEDKPQIFDAMDAVRGCVRMAAALIDEAQWNRISIESSLDHGHLDATTLMEQLVRRGLPMRTAHEAVGKLVKEAVDRKCRLADLEFDRFESLLPGRGEEIRNSLGPAKALAAFCSYGSTAPNLVREQMHEWKRRLNL
jgi:argininosuccinate lyase